MADCFTLLALVVKTDYTNHQNILNLRLADINRECFWKKSQDSRTKRKIDSSDRTNKR